MALRVDWRYGTANEAVLRNHLDQAQAENAELKKQNDRLMREVLKLRQKLGEQR
jgi:hypothetical protein